MLTINPNFIPKFIRFLESDIFDNFDLKMIDDLNRGDSILRYINHNNKKYMLNIVKQVIEINPNFCYYGDEKNKILDEKFINLFGIETIAGMSVAQVDKVINMTDEQLDIYSRILKERPDLENQLDLYSESARKETIECLNKNTKFVEQKGYVLEGKVLKKYPEDQIDNFDVQIWKEFTQMFDSDAEIDLALSEALFMIGAFEKDENARDRIEQFKSLIADNSNTNENGEQKFLTSESIKRIFSGMKMKYKPGFYQFFINNLPEILNSVVDQEHLGDLQRNWEKIETDMDRPTLVSAKDKYLNLIYPGEDIELKR